MPKDSTGVTRDKVMVAAIREMRAMIRVVWVAQTLRGIGQKG